MKAGKALWTPGPERVKQAKITKYSEWLSARGRKFESYDELWRWSVSDLEGFWTSIWDYFDVESPNPHGKALGKKTMPGAEWFPGTNVNIARHMFRRRRDGEAVVSLTEAGERRSLSWAELEGRVGAFGEFLRSQGVGRGDVVAGYLPNGIESVVAFLGTASIGGVWTGCAMDFGAQAVLDRLTQAKPKVFVAATGYSYGGKRFDRKEEVKRIVKAVPEIKETVAVGGSAIQERSVPFEDASRGRGRPRFEDVPFSDPLWVVYSSGTTGLPKPIVHGQGGILLEHLKALALHNDIGDGDRFFWFTTTGWMMWNYLVGGLLQGATIYLYDGSPAYPGMDSLWRIAETERLTFMGASAAYVASCMKADVEPGMTHELGALTGFGSTGSPLSPEAFQWVYSNVKEDIWLASISGGTDVCTAFVGGNPTLPVYAGEIQCRWLGAKVEAFDSSGKPVVGKVGELVVSEPMPSMPLYLLGDPDGARLKESYYSTFPGVWRHGDWVTITEWGTCVISGRSDATIKRMGVRIGTSEVYKAVETVPEVKDSLAVDVERQGRQVMLLFVSLEAGVELDDRIREKIRAKIREDLSPRYLPDEIEAIAEVPRTLNGKKVEVPVKRLLMGEDPGKVINSGSLQNPGAMAAFVKMAEEWRRRKV